jgi:hypothetical protein
MPIIIEPKPEFREFTETEIEQALTDPDPANPIAVEVARLIDGYVANFRAHVERLGRIPETILRATPRSPIEAVAMRLTTEMISDTIAARNG